MLKVVILALLGVIFVVLLKEQKPALSFLLTIAICVLLVSNILDYVMVLAEGMERRGTEPCSSGKHQADPQK